MILNVLPLALGVYPGLASAATLFIDPCAQTDTSAPFISQSGLYYASDVEIKIADTTAVVKTAGPPRKFIRETRRGHLLAYRSPSSSSSLSLFLSFDLSSRNFPFLPRWERGGEKEKRKIRPCYRSRNVARESGNRIVVSV